MGAYLKLEACLIHEALGENFSKLIDGTEENPGEERPDEEGNPVPLEMLPYLLWTQDQYSWARLEKSIEPHSVFRGHKEGYKLDLSGGL